MDGRPAAGERGGPHLLPRTIVVRQPESQLRPYVRCYKAYAERTDGVIFRRELPSGVVPLIVNFGPATGVMDRLHPMGPVAYHQAFTAGLHDSYALTESVDHSCGVQVDFTPIGAYLFFGCGMDTLTNRVVDLDDLSGPLFTGLAARLRDSPTVAARFALLDSVIVARLAEARPASHGVTWAWQKLIETEGRLGIGTLAAELGWSRKRLIARFREQIGLPPKLVARILRFNRALRLLRQDRKPRPTEIAYECGYYDQAHFIKEFRRFAGSAPGEFLGRSGSPDEGEFLTRQPGHPLLVSL